MWILLLTTCLPDYEPKPVDASLVDESYEPPDYSIPIEDIENFEDPPFSNFEPPSSSPEKGGLSPNPAPSSEPKSTIF